MCALLKGVDIHALKASSINANELSGGESKHFTYERLSQRWLIAGAPRLNFQIITTLSP